MKKIKIFIILFLSLSETITTFFIDYMSWIAYGSIRMEPVFMVLAQSAAMAASMAIDAKVPVQKIDVNRLQKWLQNDPYLDQQP